MSSVAANTGRSVEAEIHYTVDLASGPLDLRIRGVEFKAKGGEDILVIRRQILSGSLIVDTKIVAIFGGPGFYDGTEEMLRIRSFMNNGGVIGISKELSW
jgi:hypothetical protein